MIITTGEDGSSLVAVKTLKESAGDKERQDLLKELQVMKSLKPHPNIVTLLGSCTDKGEMRRRKMSLHIYILKAVRNVEFLKVTLSNNSQ